MRTSLTLLLASWGGVLTGRPDVVIGTNGERFSGTVLEERADLLVFHSELAGLLTIPRSGIQEIQRTGPFQGSSLPRQSSTREVPAINAAASTNLDWRPPAVGLDNSDWIQLKSGEWLKGRLRYVQERKVEFDSDELNDQSLNLKDVRQLYPSNPQFIKFHEHDELYGNLTISNNVVQVVGPEQVSLPRDQLTAMTPGGKREIDFWSGNLSVGLSLQSGNTRQANLNTSGELVRRTPSTVGQLNYLGNISKVEESQNANNQRITGSYDIRLNRRWFVRPAYLEFYRDPLANIAYQGTLGVGVGYYIFDRDGLEWKVFGGPGYQRTKHETVQAGQPDTTSTPAAVLQTSFKADITRRLKFGETIGIALTSEEAGLYSHHAVSTLEFEIKRHLDLDLSFVWDYLQYPQAESSGELPQRSDLRVNFGIGVKF